MENAQNQFEEFLKIFKRVQFNPIYFIDFYYNVVHPDKKIELTDEEKQGLFDKFHALKGVPFINTHDDWETLNKYNKWIEEKKVEGYKDWEIL